PLNSVRADEVVYLGTERSAAMDALDAALAPIASRTVVGGPLQDVRTERLVAYDSAPTAALVTRFYPPRALDRGITGGVVLNCLIQEDHTFRCGVVSQEPVGWGFAEAALRAMQNPQVRLAAIADNGQPSAGMCIRRRVSFRLG